MPADVEAATSTIDYNLEQGTSTPTIILLPFGRMLVVDGAVFAQFQADTTGLDLIELGESVARAGHTSLTLNNLADSVTRYSSTPSILEIDSETNSKHGLSPVLGSNPPPTYDSLFGNKANADLPPSYSDILRQLHELVDAEDDDDEDDEENAQCVVPERDVARTEVVSDEAAANETEAEEIRESSV